MKKFNPLYIFVICLFTIVPTIASAWQNLAPGIEYYDAGQNYLSPWAHIHVFRIDLKKNKLESVLAKKLQIKHSPIKLFAKETGALITINGGFFDRLYRPLGLRVTDNEQQNPLKRISWWGVFFIKSDKPQLTTWRNYPGNRNIEFAVQSGPRLIINNHIPSLKAGVAERTALGISKDKVLIVVTENAPMATKTLAQIMKDPPLNCDEALNLDGGSSTQIYAKIGSFNLDVQGFANVADAIIVKANS